MVKQMLSRIFLRLGASCGLVGMTLGVYMAASHDHVLAPVHAHVNLIGWVGMFLAGLFYAQRPDAAGGTLARAHLAFTVAGLLVLAPGLAGVLLGYPFGELMAALGSILTIAAMALFAVVVFRSEANPATSPDHRPARH